MFVLIFEQLMKMFFIMLLAFICYKIKLVTQEGNRSISNLLLFVVNPCLILTAYQIDYDPGLVKGLLLAFFAAAATHAAGIIISTLLIRPGSSPDYCIERYSSVYSNCGFIGIPLINSVLGATGVFYITAYMVIFNLLTWTHGVILMKKKCSLKNLKEGLVSPMFIATSAAVVMFFLQFKIPGFLLDAMNYVADMNTPLAMMVAGFSVAQSDIRKMLVNFRLYYVCAVKLLLMPVITSLLLIPMHLPETVSVTIQVAAACPAAATGTMMAIRYKQNYTYSSEIFALSTVLSIITIPLTVMISEFIL